MYCGVRGRVFKIAHPNATKYIARKAILSEAVVTGNEVFGMYATNNICLENSATINNQRIRGYCH